MENASPDSCQTCFRPKLEADAPPTWQWKSFCRCERPYSPSSQFSIDVCATCKRRVAVDAAGRAPRLCACAAPKPTKVPAYLKQNEKDHVALDLAAVGMSTDTFPADRYLPIGILGEGSRANVILARDRQRGAKVAVKCFKGINPALYPTFDSEARKNKQLTHTGITKILDIGVHNGKTPYLVTEYKDGFDLEQQLALRGIPSPDVAVKVLIGVCEALLYAQKQGVMHKAIRPGNVIFLDDMNSEPSVSVTDFALPKVKAAEALNDPYDAMFISADQARSVDFSEKSEVYTIGGVGYALLTGRPPFKDGTVSDIKQMHALKLPPKISDVAFDNKRPKELEEVVERCLEKDPGYRFESVAKLLERLEVFPRREQMRIAAVLAARRKKKILIAVAASLLIVALCAGGYFAFSHH